MYYWLAPTTLGEKVRTILAQVMVRCFGARHLSMNSASFHQGAEQGEGMTEPGIDYRTIQNG